MERVILRAGIYAVLFCTAGVMAAWGLIWWNPGTTLLSSEFFWAIVFGTIAICVPLILISFKVSKVIGSGFVSEAAFRQTSEDMTVLFCTCFAGTFFLALVLESLPFLFTMFFVSMGAFFAYIHARQLVKKAITWENANKENPSVALRSNMERQG